MGDQRYKCKPQLKMSQSIDPFNNIHTITRLLVLRNIKLLIPTFIKQSSPKQLQVYSYLSCSKKKCTAISSLPPNNIEMDANQKLLNLEKLSQIIQGDLCYYFKQISSPHYFLSSIMLSKSHSIHFIDQYKIL